MLKAGIYTPKGLAVKKLAMVIFTWSQAVTRQPRGNTWTVQIHKIHLYRGLSTRD